MKSTKAVAVSSQAVSPESSCAWASARAREGIPNTSASADANVNRSRRRAGLQRIDDL